MRDDGYEWYVTCDAAGHEVEVVYFKAPAYEKNADDEALQVSIWEPRESS